LGLQFRFLNICLCLFLLGGCASLGEPTVIHQDLTVGRPVAHPVQCVPFAREVSGIQIYGDAHSWWSRAEPRYRRGQTPQPGAVLVLARTQKMQHGHLAVVREVIDSRRINVTHSNWGNDRRTRRMIYDSMRVEDISAKNDWTRVRFWNPHDQVFGFPYVAYGFIYPN
jgi:hypothetical protein